MFDFKKSPSPKAKIPTAPQPMELGDPGACSAVDAPWRRGGFTELMTFGS